jgi:putative transposase
MFQTIRLLLAAILRCFRARRILLLENLVLRQQVAVLKRKHPRPCLGVLDKLFWVLARTFWSGWKQALIVVSPETVVRWHRAGFALYWRAISRARRVTGRKRISQEVRDLIFRMVAENQTWGAPRIHGELLMLGFDVSERTITDVSTSTTATSGRTNFRETTSCLRVLPWNCPLNASSWI